MQAHGCVLGLFGLQKYSVKMQSMPENKESDVCDNVNGKRTRS